MAKPKKPTYTPSPEVPGEIEERYRTVIQVLLGELTMSDGARKLGLSRNHFQTLVHQGVEGLIAGLRPKPPGKSARSETERKLREENEALRRENERLSTRTDGIEKMLGVASELLRSSRSLTTRASARGRTSKKGGKKTDEEPPEQQLELAKKARAMGMTPEIVAALLGFSVATLRRRERRAARKERLLRRRGPSRSRPLDPAIERAVGECVRRLRGLVGVEALRHMVPGVSRRQAAAIKARTLTAMENERIAALRRVTITIPGVLRGFDAMHLTMLEELRFVLVAADGCVPYRTSATAVPAYDSPAVVSALADDFARHGAPLVLRVDRAKSHQTAEVEALARDYSVLVLHGPPRCPRFYGQTERQNREHRAWLDAHGSIRETSLQGLCDEMVAALNGLWKRPTLGFRTAEELWLERPPLEIDRTALREEVLERTQRIQRSMTVPGAVGDLAWRLAIEQTLTNKGLLRREAGGWC